MPDPVTLFSIIASLVILGWGFERYRTRFVRSDLLIAVIFASGFLLFAFIPAVYDAAGNLLNIQKRFITISLFANIVLIGAVLYLSTYIRETRSRIDELTRNVTIKEAPLPDGGRKGIFVVIPAFNEANTIGTVVDSLPKRIEGHNVRPVVVSDGSRDNTASKADSDGTIVVEHPVNQGQGGALKTGFAIADQYDAEIVVTMDADGQHPPAELEQIVSPILADKADFVIGSRYLGKDNSGNGVVRRLGIRTFTHIINILTKSSITDCTSGYRAIRGEALEDLQLQEEKFNAPELIIEARKRGLRVTEIPILIRSRDAGETKKPQLGYAFGLARTILATWIR